MGWFLLWAVLCVAVVVLALKRGRSNGLAILFGLMSVFLSPILMGLILLLMDRKNVKTCPKCAETVNVEALVCKHCGNEFTVVAKATRVNQIKPDTALLLLFLAIGAIAVVICI